MTLTKHLEKKTNKKNIESPDNILFYYAFKLIQLFLSTYAIMLSYKNISIYKNRKNFFFIKFNFLFPFYLK